MKFNFIDKIGVEIEGGWDKTRDDLIPDAGIRMDDFKKSAICGELVSKPIDNYDEVEAFLRANWPTETQSMCGLHFHFSFKDISHYTALMHKSFHKFFLDSMQKFGESYPIQNNHFWNRLEDKNKFCKNRFAPNEQIFLKKKISNDPGRYTQLHYAYGLHKTIESRLLPTFVTVECAIAGLQAHIACFEGFLDANPPKPFDFNQEIMLDEVIDEKELEHIKVKKFAPPKVKPFNIFMAKGLIGHSNFGVKYLDAGAPKMPKPIRGKTSNNKISYDAYEITAKYKYKEEDEVFEPAPAEFASFNPPKANII